MVQIHWISTPPQYGKSLSHQVFFRSSKAANLQMVTRKRINLRGKKLKNTHSDGIHFCTLIDSVNPFENLFFKCCVEPRHLNSPFTIIANRVQSASHSSILCDVRTIDFPELRTFDIIFHRLRLAPGSMPVVGSSAEEIILYV